MKTESLVKIKKINLAKRRFQKKSQLFRCPICKSQIIVENQFYCEQGHSFDFSKKGYLNLKVNGKSQKYPRQLFEARKNICEQGFYNFLITEICQIIKEEFRDKKSLTLLDAGSGEGSHLKKITETLKNENNYYLGIDISKEGIELSSQHEADISWLVSDLAQLPIANHSLDIILNILSPANYQEFSRVLKKDGLLIKVIPNKNYLIELREYTQQEEYSNEEVRYHFEENYKLKLVKIIEQDFKITKELLDDFLLMTPLTQQLNLRAETINKEIKSIHLDLSILVGSPL
ncbi:MAG: putative RNA methyltransferase [Lactovum sp.]